MIPGNDVDLLALELVDDALDAVAPYADAGPHGVNTLLSGANRHFTAVPGFPGDCLDFHHPVVDFRHFYFEEPAKHIFMAARNQYLRAFGGVANTEDVHLGPLAFAVALGRHLLLVGQNGLGPAKVQSDGAARF